MDVATARASPQRTRVCFKSPAPNVFALVETSDCSRPRQRGRPQFVHRTANPATDDLRWTTMKTSLHRSFVILPIASALLGAPLFAQAPTPPRPAAPASNTAQSTAATQDVTELDRIV